MSKNILHLTAATICCYLIYYKTKRGNNKRSEWTKSWLRRRRGRGTLALLNRELRVEDPDSYKNFLRLTESQFEYLLDLVKSDIQKEDTLMRESISPRHRLNITLRFLATGETYRSLMYSTRIHESTISKIVPETCKAICKHLKPEYLKTPKSSNEWQKIAKDYEDKWNFPHCVGSLDGRHIVFSPPVSSGSFYHNYKGTNSIILLGLVDAHYKFLYVNVGTNGRVSDGGVFNSSVLFKKICDKTINFPQPKKLPGGSKEIPYVIIADDAFPLLDNLMKPFPQRGLTHENRIYNYRLSRARRMVESAFGILANRWRVLLQNIHLSPEKVELITITCVVLHNFLATENSSYSEMNENFVMSLTQIANQSCNSSRISSRSIREEFRNYFNSESGKVSWQDIAIERGNG